MSERDDIARGARAEALLRDELLIESFDKLEAEYIKAWRETPARDTDARERLWQAVQVVGKVRGHLQSVVDGGKLAGSQINDVSRLGERPKLFGIV